VGSIKPGVERSETPGPCDSGNQSARSVRQRKKLHNFWEIALSPASRVFNFSSTVPGVSLRFTPGFMLSPRFAG